MTSSPPSAPTARPGWSRPAFWGLAVVGASMLALFEWLQMRSMVPPEIRTAYRVWQWISWLLWVPVVAVASPLVRRMISARARPVVVLLTLLGGFLGTLVYWSAARAALSRFTGPPSVRKMPASRVFLAHFRGIIMPGSTTSRSSASSAPSSSGAGCGARPWARRDWRRTWPGPSSTRCGCSCSRSFSRTPCGRRPAFVRSGASTQAVQLLARLSDVLRLTLATLGQERVALRQEMEFVEAYLGLQQIRNPGRLRSRVDIPAEALTAEVPSLALFQLAELPATPWEGALELSATIADDRLRIRLHQLAAAQPGAEVTEAADRLVRLRQRLEQLYHGDHVLQVRHENAGLLCTLDIPLVHLESAELFPAGGLLRRPASPNGGDRRCSPHLAAVLADHRSRRRAAERLLELGQVRERPVRPGTAAASADPPSPAARLLAARTLRAPGLRVAEEELLLGREASVAQPRGSGCSFAPGLHRGEGELQPAEVRDVLAEGERAVRRAGRRWTT